MILLTDEDLLLRIKTFEDNFVERKTAGDKSDWVKTIVAFANTAPIGYPAVLYIGVRNDGTPEDKIGNLDSLQQTLSDLVKFVYPTPYYVSRVMEFEGRQVLAVMVPGSADRPHFAGPAYVREGSRTVVISAAQFGRLLAERQGKSYEILKWINQPVTVAHMRVENIRQLGPVSHEWDGAFVKDCNQFYVTLTVEFHDHSIPLNRVDIAFDNERARLKLEVYPIARS